jgi:hypothetical protein
MKLFTRASVALLEFAIFYLAWTLLHLGAQPVWFNAVTMAAVAYAVGYVDLWLRKHLDM